MLALCSVIPRSLVARTLLDRLLPYLTEALLKRNIEHFDLHADYALCSA